ncbi:hypothetical protein EDB89DRAFT_2076570 [Lactarius sanguifluus]|nr:hypothetical protein EDB89DRAFT_2076570 [Lactarius sanguifluus]
MAPRTARPLLLTVAPSFGIGALDYRDPYSSRVASLAARLHEEETRYAATLKAREGFIKKHGPSKEEVESGLLHPVLPGPRHVERVGVFGDRGKGVCGMGCIARQEKCVIYSFGINGESSFEAALLERAQGCEVWWYDFTVDSIELHAWDYGKFDLFHDWWAALEFWTESGLVYVNYNPFALGGTNDNDDNDDPKYWMVDSLVGLNRHTFIEILKINIDGGEFDAFTAFLSARAAEGNARPIGQLQLEIHVREGRENFEYFARWWVAGLRPFWTVPKRVYINTVLSARPELAEIRSPLGY